jgi:hypothetical protein
MKSWSANAAAENNIHHPLIAAAFLFFGAIIVGAIVWTYVTERVAAILIRRETLHQTSFVGSIGEGVVIGNPNREIVALLAFDDAW